MKIVYTEYINKLKNIEDYIKILEEEKMIRNMLVHGSSQICCSSEECTIKSYHIQKNTLIDSKIFNFNSIIIGLYGAYENYIENIIIAYLVELNRLIINYSDLPETIRNNNLSLSSELLLEIKKSKYEDINIEDLIINLSDCIKHTKNYKLNYRAFAKHDTNLRCDVLNQMFKRIDINGICKAIINSQQFQTYYAQEKLVDIENIPAIISRRTDKENLYTLEMLIEYRNKVAHGSTDDTIDIRELKDTYIKFMKVIGTTIYNILEESLLKYMVISKGKKINEIYHANGTILCFKSQNEEIYKGKNIIIKKNNDCFIKASILSIQLNHKEIDFVDASDSIDIGVSLDIKVKNNYEFYFI